MSLPSQAQMMLPLLEVMATAGERIRPGQCYKLIADKLGVSAEERTKRVPNGTSTVNAFERTVRWVQQRAKLLGLIERVNDGWSVTPEGKQRLTPAPSRQPRVAFVTDRGLALWGDAFDVPNFLEAGSVRAIISSPPYPILRKKSYGGITDEKTYVDWLTRLIEGWLPTLKPDGSIVLNLGDAWRPGTPTLSTYIERLVIALEDRLGLHLCQRLAWENPSKLPAPAQWVNIERCRVKPSLEPVLWFSPSTRPYANNRSVLQPYSEAMRKRIADGGEQLSVERPSGYALAQGAFAQDNGGAIPGNLIRAANTESNSRYIVDCKRHGLPVHPARFPAALPEFFVRLLSEVGDLIVDFFGGSGKTAEVAEALDRRWILVELYREFIEGAKLRFPNAT